MPSIRPPTGEVAGRCAVPATPAPCLTDPQGRRLDYLRLAVTDRCNLRCSYCMPETGVLAVSHTEILTPEENLRLARIFCAMGVRRIRITGGEPLVRRGTVDLIARMAALPASPEVLLTTNGLLLSGHLDGLVAAGVQRINLSLDSLDPQTWARITRRAGFAAARAAVDDVLARGLGLKINVVVLDGLNDHELPDFVAFTRTRPVDIRFIEAMPFSGPGGRVHAPVPGTEILRRLQNDCGVDVASPEDIGVARMYRVAGHRGRVGIIAGHTRSFCGSCRRLRVDARGRLRTCLYGHPVLDLRALLRGGASDAEVGACLAAAVAGRSTDGHVAQSEAAASGTSMARIGG